MVDVSKQAYCPSPTKVTKAMSKANSHGKSTVYGSVNNASASVAGGAGATATKHHRRPRKNSSYGAGGGGGGADRDTAVDYVGGGREYAGTAASHSQATTGPRRDALLCPSRIQYENTYRVDPQV